MPAMSACMRGVKSVSLHRLAAGSAMIAFDPPAPAFRIPGLVPLMWPIGRAVTTRPAPAVHLLGASNLVVGRWPTITRTRPRIKARRTVLARHRTGLAKGYEDLCAESGRRPELAGNDADDLVSLREPTNRRLDALAGHGSLPASEASQTVISRITRVAALQCCLVLMRKVL